MLERHLLAGLAAALMAGGVSAPGLAADLRAGAADAGRSTDRVEAEAGENQAGDDEEEIAINDLPQKVADAVKKAFPDGKIIEAERETENGKLVYEVEVETGDKVIEVELSEDGKILSQEEDDDEDGEADNKKV